MKKTFALVLSLVLILSMMVSVSAASSLVALEITNNEVEDNVVVEEIKDEVAAEEISTEEKVVELAEKLEVVDAEELTVAASFDLEIVMPTEDSEDGTSSGASTIERGENGGVIVELSVPALARKRVVLLHYVDKAWKVEYDGYTDENGKFSCEIMSFSPFAILAYSDDIAALVASSPKTGDMPVALMVGALMLSAAAIVFAVKARKA